MKSLVGLLAIVLKVDDSCVILLTKTAPITDRHYNVGNAAFFHEYGYYGFYGV